MSVIIHLLYIYLALLCFAKQVLAEEVGHFPEEVFVHSLEAVALAGEYKHLKAFVGADESIHYACGVGRVNVVVHVACHQQQVSLEAACKLLVGTDVVRECGVALNDTLLVCLLLDILLYTMVLLAPPVVVDTVVVVAGT